VIYERMSPEKDFIEGTILRRDEIGMLSNTGVVNGKFGRTRPFAQSSLVMRPSSIRKS
jgi:hypothetical protein